jgi:hypothetical protein
VLQPNGRIGRAAVVDPGAHQGGMIAEGLTAYA